MPDVVSIPLCLVLTIIIEFGVLWLIKVRDNRLWGSILINIVTNLSLNIFLTQVVKKMPNSDTFYIWILIGLEIVVVLLEGLLYQIFKKDSKNYLYSLIANGVSAILGSGIVALISLFF